MKRALLVVLTAVLAGCSGQDIEGVQNFDYDGGDHRFGQLRYEQYPPAGGPHNAVWQNCGIYEQPIPNERAVHSLEHGAVWLAYRPDLPEDQIDVLRGIARGRSYTLMAPYPGLNAPIILTSWNRQLALEDANDERVRAFIEEFENGPETPERGAACFGGSSETL